MSLVYYIGEEDYIPPLTEAGYEVVPATKREILTPHELKYGEPNSIAISLTSADEYRAIVIQYLGDITARYLNSLNNIPAKFMPHKTVPPVAIIVPPNGAEMINQRAFKNLKIHFVDDSVIPIQLEKIIKSSANK